VAILVALVWAMVERLPGVPELPGLPAFEVPLAKLGGSVVGAAVVVALLGRWISQGKGPFKEVARPTTFEAKEGYRTSADHSDLVGRRGVSLSALRPSGTARIGDTVVDVITTGDFVPAEQDIVVKEVRGAQVIVEKV